MSIIIDEENKGEFTFPVTPFWPLSESTVVSAKNVPPEGSPGSGSS